MTPSRLDLVDAYVLLIASWLINRLACMVHVYVQIGLHAWFCRLNPASGPHDWSLKSAITVYRIPVSWSLATARNQTHRSRFLCRRHRIQLGGRDPDRDWRRCTSPAVACTERLGARGRSRERNVDLSSIWLVMGSSVHPYLAYQLSTKDARQYSEGFLTKVD